MVEFGLKLEDNKVAEWSDRYIDYEKLKSLLKKAKGAAEKLASAEGECDPELVREVRASYVRRASEGRLSRTSSKGSLALSLPQNLSGVALHNMEHEDEAALGEDAAEGGGAEGSEANLGGGGGEEYGFFGEGEGGATGSSEQKGGRSEETVPLVDGNDGQYGSTSGERIDKEGAEREEPLGEEMSVPIKQKDSFSGVKGVVSGVAGYFHKETGEADDASGKERAKLEEMMKATDDCIFDFSTFLYNEVCQDFVAFSRAKSIWQRIRSGIATCRVPINIHMHIFYSIIDLACWPTIFAGSRSKKSIPSTRRSLATQPRGLITSWRVRKPWDWDAAAMSTALPMWRAVCRSILSPY